MIRCQNIYHPDSHLDRSRPKFLNNFAMLLKSPLQSQDTDAGPRCH